MNTNAKGQQRTDFLPIRQPLGSVSDSRKCWSRQNAPSKRHRDQGKRTNLKLIGKYISGSEPMLIESHGPHLKIMVLASNGTLFEGWALDHEVYAAIKSKSVLLIINADVELVEGFVVTQ